VKFGDTAADFTPQQANGTTKLVVTVPDRATGAVDVTVTNPSGVSTAAPAGKFTVTPPPPAISGLSTDRTSILGGATVTLSGTNLTGVTTVKVGTTAVAAKQVTATSLSFVTPAAKAGTVAVTVGNTWGTSSAVQLTYVTPPAPVITALDPASGLTYKTATVTVTGTELAGASKVTAGGKTVAFTKIDGTRIRVQLPAGTAGPVDLQVTTPGGVSELTAADKFTYVAPARPTVSALTPGTALTYQTTVVQVTGTELTEASKVTVDGKSVPFTKVSATQLKVTLTPRPAGDYPLVVTTPGGDSEPAKFTVTAPPVPVIGSVSAGGKTKVTNTVAVTGTGLGGASKVTLGGAPIGFTKVSDTELRVVLPAKAAGTYALAVTTPGGTSTAVTVTYQA